MSYRILSKGLGLCMAWFLLCMAAPLLAQPSSPTSVASAGATISEFKGQVELRIPGRGSASPARGLLLPARTSVITQNGKILLHLEDGSEVLVGPHSSLIIEQPSAVSWRYLELLLGRIRAQVQKRLGGAPSFQIGTPSAVISVRGTRFYAEVSPTRVTEVDVVEGLVEVASAQGLGEPVLLGPGFSTRVGESSGPEPSRPTREFRPQLERPDLKEKEKDKYKDEDDRNVGGLDDFGSEASHHMEQPEIESPVESSPGVEAEPENPHGIP